MRRLAVLLCVAGFAAGCGGLAAETRNEADPRLDSLAKEQERLSQRMDELARMLMDLKDKVSRAEPQTQALPAAKADPSAPVIEKTAPSKAISVETVPPPPEKPSITIVMGGPGPKEGSAAPKAMEPGKTLLIEVPPPPAALEPVKPEGQKVKTLVVEPARPGPKPEVKAEEKAPAPPKAVAAPDLPSAKDEAGALYVKAFNSYRAGDFGRAILDLEEFTARHPRHEYAARAQFLIGESYNQNGQFEQAIVEYNKVVDRYPGGTEAPDAIFMIGDCFDKLGQRERARSFYTKLVKQYPDGEAAYRARKKLESP